MAERHAILNSRALATLLQRSDRVSRISDGFGDFCFAPKPFSCVDCSFDSMLPRRPGHQNISNNALEADTAEHTTVGDSSSLNINETPDSPFPFLDLPKDIRDAIYGYFIEPFRNPWQNGGIKVQIGIVYNRRCHPFRNGYEMRVPVTIKPPRIPYRSGQPNDDSSEESSDESDDESGDESDDEPGNQPNNQPIDQPNNQPKDEHVHLKRQNYDAIWSLSKVNHQIRAEVGNLFWNNVYVDVDHFEYLLIDFLQDRPAVHKGIKKLRTSWDCEDDETDLNYIIIDFCQYLSQHLVLDELIFELSTSPAIARRILASEGDLDWIQAVRKINVKTLKVDLFLRDGDDDVFDDEDDDSDSNEEEDERYARLARGIAPKMEVLLRPVVPVVEITDQDEYLMSRGL